jgi:transposase InsO family protein
VSAMVRVLKVHRSCYYDWLKRPVRDDHSAERAEMAKIQEEADGSYGVRRMAPELRSLGFPVGKKLVARLMREEGVQGRIRRTKPYGKGCVLFAGVERRSGRRLWKSQNHHTQSEPYVHEKDTHCHPLRSS